LYKTIHDEKGISIFLGFLGKNFYIHKNVAYECGIRSGAKDIHAYSEGRLCEAWSPEEYVPLVMSFSSLPTDIIHYILSSFLLTFILGCLYREIAHVLKKIYLILDRMPSEPPTAVQGCKLRLLTLGHPNPEWRLNYSKKLIIL
jgi:hypothetical protein